MRQIIISFIPPEAARLNEIGDWFFTEDGNLHVKVVDLGNWRFNVLFARHEMDEAILCKQNGISTEEVDADQLEHRGETDDPDSFSGYPGAPYQNQHNDALASEWQLGRLLNVDWDEYAAACEEAEKRMKLWQESSKEEKAK